MRDVISAARCRVWSRCLFNVCYSLQWCCPLVNSCPVWSSQCKWLLFRFACAAYVGCQAVIHVHSEFCAERLQLFSFSVCVCLELKLRKELVDCLWTRNIKKKKQNKNFFEISGCNQCKKKEEIFFPPMAFKKLNKVYIQYIYVCACVCVYIHIHMHTQTYSI